MGTDGFRDLVVGCLIGMIWISGAAGPVLAHNGAVQENDPTTATVTDLGIETKETDDGTEYRPVVTYEYSVDGRTYRQSNVYPGSFTRWKVSEREVRATLAEYEIGQTVTVYYNPKQHSHAYLREGGMPWSWFVGVGIALFMLVTGTNRIRKGFGRRKQRNLIRETPTETARSLSMGPSEITGVARAVDDDPDPAPFTDEDCVLAKWEILEYDHDSGEENTWTQVTEGFQRSPFHVEDETGRALVRPHEDATYELDEDDWTTVYVEGDSRGPDPVQRFVDRRSGLDHSSNGDGLRGDRKYRQNLVRTGDSAYVYGTVQPRDDQTGTENVDNLVIEKVGDDDPRAEPMFVIADRSEDDLAHSRRFALWRLPVGIALVLGGVGLLLGILGHKIGVSLPVV